MKSKLRKTRLRKRPNKLDSSFKMHSDYSSFNSEDYSSSSLESSDSDSEGYYVPGWLTDLSLKQLTYAINKAGIIIKKTITDTNRQYYEIKFTEYLEKELEKDNAEKRGGRGGRGRGRGGRGRGRGRGLITRGIVSIRKKASKIPEMDESIIMEQNRLGIYKVLYQDIVNGIDKKDKRLLAYDKNGNFVKEFNIVFIDKIKNIFQLSSDSQYVFFIAESLKNNINIHHPTKFKPNYEIISDEYYYIFTSSNIIQDETLELYKRFKVYLNTYSSSSMKSKDIRKQIKNLYEKYDNITWTNVEDEILNKVLCNRTDFKEQCVENWKNIPYNCAGKQIYNENIINNISMSADNNLYYNNTKINVKNTKISEGTYGLVYKITDKTDSNISFALKSPKPNKYGIINELEEVELLNKIPAECHEFISFKVIRDRTVNYNYVIMPLITGDLSQLNVKNNIKSIKKILYILGKNLLCIRKYGMHYIDIKDVNTFFNCNSNDQISVFFGDLGSMIEKSDTSYTVTFPPLELLYTKGLIYKHLITDTVYTWLLGLLTLQLLKENVNGLWWGSDILKFTDKLQKIRMKYGGNPEYNFLMSAIADKKDRPTLKEFVNMIRPQDTPRTFQMNTNKSIYKPHSNLIELTNEHRISREINKGDCILLFYKKDCPYCNNDEMKSVIYELCESGIRVVVIEKRYLRQNKYNIKTFPTFLINNNRQLSYYVGDRSFNDLQSKLK